MLTLALTSITVGIFDVKHYLHLQLVPHLSKHHQARMLPQINSYFPVLTPLVSTGEYLLTMLPVQIPVTYFWPNCYSTTWQSQLNVASAA